MLRYELGALAEAGSRGLGWALGRPSRKPRSTGCRRRSPFRSHSGASEAPTPSPLPVPDGLTTGARPRRGTLAGRAFEGGVTLLDGGPPREPPGWQRHKGRSAPDERFWGALYRKRSPRRPLESSERDASRLALPQRARAQRGVRGMQRVPTRRHARLRPRHDASWTHRPMRPTSPERTRQP